MNSTRRTLIAGFGGAVVAAATLFATAPAFARDPAAPGPVTGTVVLSATGAAAGVGYTWGDGILTFQGKQHFFSVNGVSIADVGFSKVSGRGRVYKLKKLSDFSGTYVAATGEATAGTGLGGRILQNANGVQIRIDEVTRGARLQGSADGIQLTLK